MQLRLIQDNAHLARSHVQAQVSDRSTLSTPVSPRESVNMSSTSKQRWSVGPEPAWLSSPIISRPLVGWNLLSRATLFQIGSGEASNYPYRMDTWSSPFMVAYLNVGRRHLVRSLGEVVQIVLAHRPDILFRPSGPRPSEPGHLRIGKQQVN